MTPEVVKFDPAHLTEIESRESESLPRVLMGQWFLRTHDGIAFTIKAGGKVIGAAGVILGPVATPRLEIREREGYAWALFGPEIGQCPVWLHRTVKRYFERIVVGYRLRRVIADQPSSQRNYGWLTALGFVSKGGVMECLGWQPYYRR